jgi:signal transduction histidine kinase
VTGVSETKGGPASGGAAGPPPDRWPVGIGWLTGLSVAAVLAINLVGISGIALSRRAAIDEAAGALRLETVARALDIERRLASIRADLAFLAGSPSLFDLEAGLTSRDPALARFRRLDAEGATLIFLRGHPELVHLRARSQKGTVLIVAGRRGGVPVLWVPSRDREEAGNGGGDRGDRVTGRFEFTAGVRKVEGAAILEATLDPARLLESGGFATDASRACVLRDGGGSTLGWLAGGGREAEAIGAALGGPAGGGNTMMRFDAVVRTEGWSAPAPWSLVCGRAATPAVAAIEPFASRYRMALILNLTLISLAVLLGAFVLHQGRRQQRLEARAREEARVRELERQLFHAERLGTVGRLAAGMAHEINNPLEGVANHLTLAEEAIGRGAIAAARERLGLVREGVRRVSSVVRQVLSHADPATAMHSEVDLGPLLQQTIEFVRSRPEFRAIRFEYHPVAGPLLVRGAPALLGQVFLNLLVNAGEAQPAGGEILVETRSAPESVWVEFADRGPGVAPEDAGRIFEPFFSTKNSTGLGLSICYAIVGRHGGDLTVAARDGGGARFRIRLPAAGVTA